MKKLKVLIPLAILPVILLFGFSRWYWWNWDFMIKAHTVIKTYEDGGNETERD